MGKEEIKKTQFINKFDVCPELDPVAYTPPPHHALGWPYPEPAVSHYTCKVISAGKPCVKIDNMQGIETQGRCIIAKINEKVK